MIVLHSDCLQLRLSAHIVWHQVLIAASMFNILLGDSRPLTEKVDFHRWGGIDALRLLALALIYLSHTLSITDNDSLAQLWNIRFGRLGTSLFFIVAGYMAAGTTRTPATWLAKRLRTLLPPYWIVLLPTFFAVWLTSYKTFDAWQVIAQFLALGLFTHPSQLVNVTTWFISALLVMYLIAYLAKCTSETLVIVAALAISVVLGQLSVDPRIGWASLASAFLAAYLLPRKPHHLLLAAVVVGLAYLATFPVLGNTSFKHAGIAFLVFAIFTVWRRSWAPLARVADYSYEWFLVHGPALHAARLVVGSSFWPVFLVGVAITIAGAMILKPLTRSLINIFTARTQSFLSRRAQRVESEHIVDREVVTDQLR